MPTYFACDQGVRYLITSKLETYSMKILISNLYKEYKKYNKSHLSSSWFNFNGWSKRLYGNTDYYVDLILKENKIIKEYKTFVIETLKKEDKLNKESISEIVIAMKNHRERIISRSSYLVILAASFGLITVLTRVSLSTEMLSLLSLLFIIIALFIMLVEREKLNIQATIAQELINILDFIKNDDLKSYDVKK